MKHIKSHTKHQCSKCGKVFTGIERLIEHQKIHNNERPYNRVRHETYKCDQCRKTFMFKIMLMRHLKTHNADEPQSYQNEKVISGRRCFSTHQGNFSQYKLFGCSHCDKVFVAEKYLIQHLRTHSGEKPSMDTTTCVKKKSPLPLYNAPLRLTGRYFILKLQPVPGSNRKAPARKCKVCNFTREQ